MLATSLFPEDLLSPSYSEDLFPLTNNNEQLGIDTFTDSVLSSPIGSPSLNNNTYQESTDFLGPIPEPSNWSHTQFPTLTSQPIIPRSLNIPQHPQPIPMALKPPFPFQHPIPLFNISNLHTPTMHIPSVVGSTIPTLPTTPNNAFEPEDPTAAKRGRKRARVSTLPSATVTLTKEQLVSITSEEYESLVKGVSVNRPLTTAEKEEVKRQRRLIKNRESAQASRSRKKQHITTLEAKVEHLQKGNATLKERYASLDMENKLLKNEVSFLTNLMNCIKVAS